MWNNGKLCAMRWFRISIKILCTPLAKSSTYSHVIPEGNLNIEFRYRWIIRTWTFVTYLVDHMSAMSSCYGMRCLQKLENSFGHSFGPPAARREHQLQGQPLLFFAYGDSLIRGLSVWCTCSTVEIQPLVGRPEYLIHRRISYSYHDCIKNDIPCDRLNFKWLQSTSVSRSKIRSVSV